MGLTRTREHRGARGHGAAFGSRPGVPGTGLVLRPGGCVEVNGNGTVLQGLSIPYDVDVTASDVTIKDVGITVTGNGFGVSLRHTRNVTVEDSDIYGGECGFPAADGRR